jgi:hypothetical protein
MGLGTADRESGREDGEKEREREKEGSWID